MTALMSTSLNVVSMAAVFCASFRRRAMVWRSLVMRTRSSREASSGGDEARAWTGAGAGAAAAPPAMAVSMSPLVARPSRPLAATEAGLTPLSRARRATAGPWSCTGRAAAGAGAGFCASAGFAPAAGPVAAPPSTIEPSTAPGVTVSPSLATMSPSVPAAGAFTSRVTLSVSSSRIGSSALTGSPGFLNQRPIVGSETDLPRVGTRISVAMVFSFSVAPGSGRATGPGALRCSSSRKNLVEKRLQLRHVLRHEARGGGRRRPPSDIPRTLHLGPCGLQDPFEIGLDERPRAHVLRLLLAPHHVRLLEPGELDRQGLHRKRVELLDPQQVDVVDAALFALFVEVVVDLAGAQHDAADLVVPEELHALGSALRIVDQHPVEMGALRDIGKAGGAALVAQQRLRGHQDERLAEVTLELAAQDVEIVRGRRAVRDLHVVLRAHLQKALEPRRGMLRPLALVAVREETHEPGHAQPLAFARRDELVEHHLRPVGEVAELRLPQGEGVRLRQGIAVLEPEHRLLGEHRVDDLVARLTLADVVERRVPRLGLLIDQNRMALREGAA